MRKCPKCKSSDRIRARRSSWLKKIPTTKAYICQACRKRYIYIGLLGLCIGVNKKAVH